MTRFNDITGQRFGSLIALYTVQRGKNTTWRCMCDCGNETTQKAQNLRGGQVKSCICMRCVTHGGARKDKLHPLYKTWVSMRSRCNTPTRFSYKYYGGRGIRICERWNDFGNFVADVGERPKGTTLDRINNDGNYEPGNVRWATSKQQAQNKYQRGKSPINAKLERGVHRLPPY